MACSDGALRPLAWLSAAGVGLGVPAAAVAMRAWPFFAHDRAWTGVVLLKRAALVVLVARRELAAAAFALVAFWVLSVQVQPYASRAVAPSGPPAASGLAGLRLNKLDSLQHASLLALVVAAVLFEEDATTPFWRYATVAGSFAVMAALVVWPLLNRTCWAALSAWVNRQIAALGRRTSSAAGSDNSDSRSEPPLESEPEPEPDLEVAQDLDSNPEPEPEPEPDPDPDPDSARPAPLRLQSLQQLPTTPSGTPTHSGPVLEDEVQRITEEHEEERLQLQRVLALEQARQKQALLDRRLARQRRGNSSSPPRPVGAPMPAAMPSTPPGSVEALSGAGASLPPLRGRSGPPLALEEAMGVVPG